MARLLLLLCLLFSCYALYPQTGLRFNYDAAGNQIYRGPLTSPQSEELVVHVDSLGMSVQEQAVVHLEHREEPNLYIAASPNPVSHQLQVIWKNTDQHHFIQLSLFSYHNQHLLEVPLRSSLESLQLDFSSYPQGIYFLIFRTNTSHTQTYKVIKK